MDERGLWRARLRWRWRGALLWPLFVALTVADALLLGVLPIAGDGGTALVPALLLAGALNLIAVALLGRPLAWWLRRRRPDLPKVVADDTTGAALVVLVSLGLVGAGLAHRSSVQEAQRDLAASEQAARRWVAHQGPPDYRANVAGADTLKLADDFYRSCVPGPDPDRALCLFVTTDSSPPGVRVDRSEEPNSVFRGPLGRR